LDAGGAVFIADDVQRFLIWRNAHAIGLPSVRDDAVDRAIGIDPVHAHYGLLDWFVAEVPGVAEVDATLLVDGEVVWRIERPPLEHARDDVAPSGFHVGASHSATAVVGPLGNDHVARRVELDAVRHAAGRAADR